MYLRLRNHSDAPGPLGPRSYYDSLGAWEFCLGVKWEWWYNLRSGRNQTEWEYSWSLGINKSLGGWSNLWCWSGLQLSKQNFCPNWKGFKTHYTQVSIKSRYKQHFKSNFNITKPTMLVNYRIRRHFHKVCFAVWPLNVVWCAGDLVKVIDCWSWRESLCDCVWGSRPESESWDWWQGQTGPGRLRHQTRPATCGGGGKPTSSQASWSVLLILIGALI